MELHITLQPKQREAIKLLETTPIVFMGGARGGGKSYTIRSWQVLRRLKYPNTKGLIFRKTYPELLSNHIRMFFKEYPATSQWFNKSEKTIYWPNGSITEFSYLQNTDDVYTYQGREYDDISGDEVQQHEYEVIKVLRSSLRTTNPDIKPRMLLTGNPGGKGHAQLKRLFIDKKYTEFENPSDYGFVQSFVQDNQALMDADPEYVGRLNDLPEHLRRAYLYGDWNIFAGTMFTQLIEKTHMIPAMKLPTSTQYFAGYDYGYNHPFAFVVCALTPDGQYYVVSHLRKRFCQPEEQGRLMLKMLENKGNVIVYAGHDIYADREGGRTIYDQLLDSGFKGSKHSIVKASINHIQGVAQLRTLFALQPDGIPHLQFFSNTKEVFDCLLEQQIDPNKPEDVVKLNAVDGEGGDDLYDALRGAVLAWTLPKTPTKQVKPNTGEALLQKRLQMAQVQKGWR